MKIEISQEVSDLGQFISATIGLVVVLTYLAFSVSSCDAKSRAEKTLRCKATIEAKADPVTINDACGGL